MGFTHVQGTGVATTTVVGSSSVAFSSNVTMGNYVLVQIACYRPGGVTLTVSDTQTNSYIEDIYFTFGYGSTVATTAIFRALVGSTGALTVTVSASATCLISFAIDEFSVTSGTLMVDNTSTGSGLSATPTMGSMLISSTDLVLACFDIHTSGLTYTAGSTFILGFTANSILSESFVSEYNPAVSPGTAAPPCTLSSSSAWSGCAVAYLLSIPPTNVFSSDSSSLSDGGLIGIEQADSPSSLESFLLASSVYMGETALPSSIQYVSSLLYLSDSSSFLESHLSAIATLLGNDAGSSLESQYATSGITDVYQYDADSAQPSSVATILSSMIDLDQYQSIENFYLSDTMFNVNNSVTDEAHAFGSHFLSILDSQLLAESEAYNRTTTPIAMVEISKDQTSVKDAYYYNSTVFNVESSRSIEVNAIAWTMTVADAAFPSSQMTLYRLHYGEIVSVLDSLHTKFYSTESPQAIDGYFQSNSIYSADSGFNISSYYLTAAIQQASNVTVDSGFGIEASWLARGLDGESPSGLEKSLRSINSSDLASYSSQFLKLILTHQTATEIDQYSLNNMLLASSAITDSAIPSSTSFLFILADNTASPQERNITEIYSHDSSKVISTYYMLSYVFYVDQGIAIY